MSGGMVLIMAGGTGGHVFPALAVARALRTDGIAVAWLGSRGGMEERVVRRDGIAFHGIRIRGLRGKGVTAWLLAPLRLAGAVAEALAVMIRLRPRVVLGMGGFAAGPGGLAAWLLRRPLVIHEQNAVAGWTNRLLARLARRVLGAYPNVLGSVEAVGNPVRPEIAALPAPEVRLAGREGPLRVLVLGGSQGARALNATVPEALAQLPAGIAVEVIHQTGVSEQAQTQQAYARFGVQAEVLAFIEDMATAYGWADLAVCRAGALTLAEVTAAGVGTVLVPYPHAVDDHQTRNAEYLVAAGAAVLQPQDSLTVAGLAELLAPLLGDRDRLRDMARQARGLARPDATAEVVRVLRAEGGLA
ncbi:MAG: undecaprenyldiphospho-muramoylpentapeptide beta-N-acetylglucosaminyltransferase [Candidatus Macondimonas sp.]